MRCLKSLLVMVEKMSKIRDSKGVFSAVVADLYEAFDCILRGLLIGISNAFISIKKRCSVFLPISANEIRKLR